MSTILAVSRVDILLPIGFIMLIIPIFIPPLLGCLGLEEFWGQSRLTVSPIFRYIGSGGQFLGAIYPLRGYLIPKYSLGHQATNRSPHYLLLFGRQNFVLTNKKKGKQTWSVLPVPPPYTIFLSYPLPWPPPPHHHDYLFFTIVIPRFHCTSLLAGEQYNLLIEVLLCVNYNACSTAVWKCLQKHVRHWTMYPRTHRGQTKQERDRATLPNQSCIDLH